MQELQPLSTLRSSSDHTSFNHGFLLPQMAAIFPRLNTYACIATKWTRHLGFCITYSSLLLKTWR